MMKRIRWAKVYLNIWRILPAFLIYRTNKFRKECAEDLQEWVRYFPEVLGYHQMFQLGFILVNQKETRNIFLNRLHRNPLLYVLVRVCFPPLESLYINMPPERIGGGFSVQHGFSTIIAAKKIGKRCRIFQQVTVGYNGEENPVLGDDVIITAGAIVVGNVYIGNGAVVGAGAVVVKDVPEGMIVAGVPARTIGEAQKIPVD